MITAAYHESCYISLRLSAQRRPEIISGSISIRVLFEIIGDTVQESLNTKVAAQHTDGAAALQITDVIKDLVNLKSV